MTMSELLHYEIHPATEQRAQTILFVHGAGGSTRTWRKQVEAFSGHYHLLVIDLPGHAGSAKSSSKTEIYSFDWISTKIWEVVDYLGIDKLHIVAVSLGSIISMEMYHHHPSRVLSVVCAGPIVSLNTKLRILARTGLTIAKVIGYQKFYGMMARIVLPRKNHKKSREIFVRESKFLSDGEYKKWTGMYGICLDSTLKKLFNHNPSVPVYLLVGGQDHLFLAPAQQYANRFAQVQIEIVDRCGHLVSLEKSDVFNEKCMRFLASVKN
jgi:pimeloyl-ACP methyl ester carboxylesterase